MPLKRCPPLQPDRAYGSWAVRTDQDGVDRLCYTACKGPVRLWAFDRDGRSDNPDELHQADFLTGIALMMKWNVDDFVS